MAGFLLAISMSLVAANAAVPKAMLGTWSSGSCSDAAKLLVIAPSTVAMGTAAALPVVYVPDDDGAGNGAIHWTAEGSVDNFVYVASTDTIVYNAQGYHMPGAVAYKRCTAQ